MKLAGVAGFQQKNISLYDTFLDKSILQVLKSGAFVSLVMLSRLAGVTLPAPACLGAKPKDLCVDADAGSAKVTLGLRLLFKLATLPERRYDAYRQELKADSSSEVSYATRLACHSFAAINHRKCPGCPSADSCGITGR
jgi:hypothetical protein